MLEAGRFLRFFRVSNFLPTIGVVASLICGFVVTGFASSAYRRERTKLGQEHYREAQRLESQAQVEASLEEFRKALFFSPDQTEYGISLATALIEAGKLDEAESHLEQLLQEDPTNGRLNLLLARVAMKNRNVKQAVEYYHRAVYEYWPPSQLPERRQARWELAALLNKTGDQSGYVAELMQLYANLPAADEAQRLRVGFALLNSGATAEAGKVFAALLQQDGQNAAVRYGLGEVNLAGGNYITARHEFQRALRLNPQDEASASKLVLTNEIIDFDPFLPDLVLGERIRRSRNLLAAVVRIVKKCSGVPAEQSVKPDARSVKAQTKDKTQTSSGTAADAMQQRLTDAENLLKKAGSSDDLALQFRQTARALWNDRQTICPGPAPPSDPAVDTIIGKMAYE
jgi:tetratricopeptide (TPR) repeat protein